ncbi:MAG: prephenate dehydrogenase [Micrococcales bacterium]
MTRLTGQVKIIGAGLLGTSIGLALRKAGIDVIVSDVSRATQALAIDYGAGRESLPTDSPKLIVVCVPPDITAEIVGSALAEFPEAVVTDVASVKVPILKELEHSGAPLQRYVGSHPMAGRERGGAISGRADLFVGRPWVVVANPESDFAAVNLVTDLALDLQSVPVAMEALEHDHAVAAVSHVPQLVASLLAARLISTSAQEISLAGQGLRDTTRIAGSDPKLWVQILSANASQVAPVLREMAADLERVIEALDKPTAPGSLTAISRAIEAGNRGVERIPGKHGGRHTNYSTVVVMIDDKPGELARLLTEIGQIGINVEDLKLEHSPGAQIGLPEISIAPEVEEKLVQELTARGWRLL